MIISKAELEDIWGNKPFGYLKKHKNELKKYKTYFVSFRPYNINRLQDDKFKVRAISKYMAETQARKEYTEKYNIKTDPYSWNTSITVG